MNALIISIALITGTEGTNVEPEVLPKPSQPTCADQSCVRKTRAQRICETRVRYMARYRIRGHVLPHLGYGEGRFEGVGWGSHPNCSTCVGSGRVLGDAVAKSGNTYYRARIYERSGQRMYRYRARRWWRR